MAQAGSIDALAAPARLALGFAAAVAAVCIATAVLVGRLEGAEIALLACASVALAMVIVQAIAALARGQDRLLERLEMVGSGVGVVAGVGAAPDLASVDGDKLTALLAEVQDELERRRGGGAPLRPDPALVAQAEARLEAARAEARERAARRPHPRAEVKRS